MAWQDTVDMTVWDVEPDPVPEASFSGGAPDPMWTAWNEWAPEVQVAEFCGVLADLLEPDIVIETGASQGFITRRLLDRWSSAKYRDVWVYEADDQIRGRIPDWVDVMVDVSPRVDQVAQADLLVLDSHWPERISELRLWWEHGKPGSFVFLHDVKPTAAPGTGHRMLADLVAQMESAGLPVMWFQNPRGSALIYRDDNRDDYIHWPTVRQQAQPSDPTQSGGVFIAQIDPGQVAGAFAHSMWKMTAYSMQHPGLLAGGIRRHGGPRVYASRDAVVRHFLTTDAQWLLQIDSDMVFPHTLLETLISAAHPQDRPIVAGHCYMWRGETGPMATMWSVNPDGDSDADMVMVESYPKGGLVEVAATGAACLLVHRRVFEIIQQVDPEYRFPWFEETMNGDKPVGEDLTFCIRARRAGFPVFVHTGVDVGHVKTETMDNAYFEDWRKARRTIITGWPRGATGYMSQVMLKAGVMCMHEAVHTPEGVDWGTRWADSSWLAAPHLAGFDGPIIHVVRDPRKVLASLLAIRLFDPDHTPTDMLPFRDFAHSHVPPEQGMTWAEYTVWFMLQWHDMIWNANPDLTVRVEDINPDLLRRMTKLARSPNLSHDRQLAEAIAAVPTDWNRPSEGHPPELSWDDIQELVGLELTRQLHRLSITLGYDD